MTGGAIKAPPPMGLGLRHMSQTLTQNPYILICVSTSLHPNLPIMATTSGQRRLRHPEMGSAGSSDDESGDDQEMDIGAHPEHSLKLWSLRHGQGVR